jgi:hypothetical protein
MTLYAIISLIFFCQANSAKLEASTVAFGGNETLNDVLKLLNATGNSVVDGRNEQTPNPRLSLNGKQTFWQALDALCQKANCAAQWRGEQLMLLPSSVGRVPVAYDGPLRVAVKQCRVTNQFDHPEASRLTLQLELSSEPKLHPLLFKISPGHIRAKPNLAPSEQNDQQAVVTYRFEDGKYKLFDVNLPKPPRSQTKLTSLSLDGTVWVSISRLDFESELLVGAKKEQQGTTCQIIGVDVDDVSKTWEVAVKLNYPEASLDWESNQAGLLGKTIMVLVNEKKQRIPSIGQEVRSDQGRQLEIRWLFRNVPGQVGAWRVLVQTPSPPMAFPFRIMLKDIELP